MNLKYLEYLIDIAKTHSLSLSSERLFITQPALSRIIKLLENEYNITILSRTPNGVFFTEDGLKLLAFAQTTISAHQMLCREIQSPSQPLSALSGHLFVYSQIGFFELFLNDTLAIFQKQHPQVKLDVLYQHSNLLLNLLRNAPEPSSTVIFSEIFCDTQTITPIPMHHPPENYSFYPLRKSTPLLVVPAGSALSKYQSISLDSVASKYDFALLTDYPATDTLPIQQTLKSRKPLHILLRTNVVSIWLEAILSGRALGFMVKELHHVFIPTAQYQNALTYIPLKQSSSVTSYLGYFFPKEPSATAEAFKDILNENIPLSMKPEQ